MVIVILCRRSDRLGGRGAGEGFPHLLIALVLYRVFVCIPLVLAMCILVMQGLGVCSLCLYSLDASF